MNIDDIKKSLVDNGYTQEQAEVVANEITVISEPLVPLFEHWVNSRREDDFRIHEFSLLEVKELFDMTYPAAILTMDWIIKDPETALKALNRGLR